MLKSVWEREREKEKRSELGVIKVEIMPALGELIYIFLQLPKEPPS